MATKGVDATFYSCVAKFRPNSKEDQHGCKMDNATKLNLISGNELGNVKGIRIDGLPAFIVSMARGPKNLVKNFDAQIFALINDTLVLPVTVNDGSEVTCFVSSPTEFYVNYANDEIRRLNGGSIPLWVALLNTLSLTALTLSNADRVAYVNNWPVWTNPYPQIRAALLGEMTKLILRAFPRHLIGFRSLNWIFHRELLNELQDAGYLLVPANHAYVCDFTDPAWKISRDLRRDLNFLKKTDQYECVEHDDVKPTDYARIAWLYNKLNILKYTPRNPQFSEEFFRTLHQTGIAKLFGLRSTSGNLEGAIGNINLGGIHINLFTGYNTDVEQGNRLFRLLQARIFEEALSQGRGLNLGAASGGAAEFKRNRGAKPVLEYNAFYAKHLPWYRQALLGRFKASADSVGVNIMRRFDI